MRKALCRENISFADGSLNLKYFNVKKGHYWSHKENEKLIKGVIKHGACQYAAIKRDFLQDWSVTEVRLRICKLLRRYKLDAYKDTKFTCEEQIFKEADKNKDEALKKQQDSAPKTPTSLATYMSTNQALASGKAQKQIKLVGGIMFDPEPI